MSKVNFTQSCEIANMDRIRLELWEQASEPVRKSMDALAQELAESYPLDIYALDGDGGSLRLHAEGDLLNRDTYSDLYAYREQLVNSHKCIKETEFDGQYSRKTAVEAAATLLEIEYASALLERVQLHISVVIG